MSTLTPSSQHVTLPSLRPRLLALGAVTCTDFIENGMVMFSAGPIMAGLHLGMADFGLSYALYGMAAIVMLCKHRWMVERLGYERFVLWSLLVFGAGALLCAMADGFVQFAAGRAMQGLGGATFFTAGRLAVQDLPGPTRFTGLLVFVASLLGGSALAPLLAAFLLELGGWRAIFLFGVPQAMLVAWLVRGRLSREKSPSHERSREHWAWLLWLCVGVFGLQYAIEALNFHGRGSRHVAFIAAVSLLMLGCFAWRQSRRERPLLDARALFQARYLFGLVMYFIGYFLIGIAGLLLPIVLHKVMGLSLLATALITSTGLVLSASMGVLHMFLARRWPWHRFYMLCGVALYGVGCAVLALFNGAPGRWWMLLPGCFALMLAIPLFLGPVAFGTFAGLSAESFSHGYQVKNIVRQLGLSSSAALTMFLLDSLARTPVQVDGLAGMTRWIVTPQLTQPAGLLANQQVFALILLVLVPLGMLVGVQRIFR